jgi:hypothetical protein
VPAHARLFGLRVPVNGVEDPVAPAIVDNTMCFLTLTLTLTPCAGAKASGAGQQQTVLTFNDEHYFLGVFECAQDVLACESQSMELKIQSLEPLLTI